MLPSVSGWLVGGEDLTAEGFRSVGQALLDSGAPRSAEQVFRSACERWPDRLGLQLKLARALEEQGRQAEAESLVEQAVLARDSLPNWSVGGVGHFGFAICHGVKLDLRDEVVTPWMVDRIVHGNYERTESNYLREVLKPDDVVLEVGGGIGFMAAFAKLCQPTATVVSYEANPGLMPVVERTKQINGLDFDARNAMLGAEAGSSEFHVTKAFWASSATHKYDGASTITVPVEAVGSVMSEQPFNVVVMDIEGGEIDLLDAMDLTGVDRLILETHPKITGQASIKRTLKRLKGRYGLKPVQDKGHVLLIARED